MRTVTTIAFGGLAVAGMLCLVRLVRGPSVPNRMVALDTLLVVIVNGIAVGAARTRDGTYLDAMVVAALLGLVGTVTVARVVESRRME